MSYLDDILRATRARVDELQSVIEADALEQRIAAAERPRGFRRALLAGAPAIIAEIKRATPRAGELDLGLNAGEIAAAYARGGATAISVVTEPDFFRGSMEDLRAARGAGLPVLRKDFVIDAFQVLEARAWGADAVLVIVRVLGADTGAMHAAVESLGMDALVEVHDESELAVALDCGAGLIGVNHRDLTTFELDPDRTAKLAPMVPKDATLIALSGIKERADVTALFDAGARAVLVGESVVTSGDPEAKVAELAGTR